MNKFATIYHKLGGLIIVNDLLVLLIKVGEVDNEVLDDKSAREGSDGSGLGSVCVDGLKDKPRCWSHRCSWRTIHISLPYMTSYSSATSRPRLLSSGVHPTPSHTINVIHYYIDSFITWNPKNIC